MADIQTRPRPILAAAKSIGVGLTLVGTVISALVTIGMLTVAQGTAVQQVVTVVGPLVTAVTGLLAAFGVVHKAEGQVTPLSDPRDNAGNPLLPVPKT